MLHKVFSTFLLLLALFAPTLHGETLPLNQLKQVADGLNIEGGTIAHKYLNKNQVWSNICVVLDRPFEDYVEWQEMTNANTFPLKEAAIPDYNESQVNYAYILLMNYYIKHAHQISKKDPTKTSKIIMQVHRNTSGPRHIALLEDLLVKCCPELQFIKKEKASSSKYILSKYFFHDHNVEVEFCYGVHPDNLGSLGKYNEVDIVLSFSLIAGFHSEWKSGTLVIPYEHTPLPLKTLKLDKENKYFVNNHLKMVLDDLLKTQDPLVLQIVNEEFNSFNLAKKTMSARLLCADDFKEARLLQVDGLFNPSQLSVEFSWD